MTPLTRSRPSFVRALSALVVCALPLLLGGWIGGPQSTFDTKGPVARAQLDVFWVTVYVTMIIFVLVASVLAYATWKFKAKDSDADRAPPEQGHGNPLIELGLIGLSVFALVIIAVPTMKAIWYTYDVPEAERANAYEVTAIGYQWWFKFEYPKEQIAEAGPLVTANELVIPAGRPVRVNLRTVDVIHSFWIPKLAGKVDMIPNRGNHMWIKADEPGYFWGQCAEYCGESHAVMRFRVIALSEKDFADWLANQKLPARSVDSAVAANSDRPKVQFASYTPVKRNTPGWTEEFDKDPMNAWVKKQAVDANEDPALIAQGKRLFKEKNCLTCHAVRGHSQDGAPFAGVTAPDLTRVGARTTIAGGLLENNDTNLIRWVIDPDNVKPGNKMWVGVGSMAGYVKRDESGHWVRNIEVSETEAHALVAYLHSLK